MAIISGSITGATNVSKAFSGAGTVSARDAREVWLVSADFAAYTGASDTAQIQAVGAAISSRAADGKTRTVRWAAPAYAGADTANQAVYFTGTAVQAATVSTDDITGQLSVAAGTEVTSTTGVSSGVAVLVGVD